MSDGDRRVKEDIVWCVVESVEREGEEEEKRR